MEWAALLTAVITVVAAILDHRRATAPQRERDALEAAYAKDMERANTALTHGDAKTLTQSFDEERQQGIVRGDLDPRGPDPGRVRGGYAGTDQQ